MSKATGKFPSLRTYMRKPFSVWRVGCHRGTPVPWYLPYLCESETRVRGRAPLWPFNFQTNVKICKPAFWSFLCSITGYLSRMNSCMHYVIIDIFQSYGLVVLLTKVPNESSEIIFSVHWFRINTEIDFEDYSFLVT